MQQGPKKFLKINGNPEASNSFTLFNVKDGWFAIFTFVPEGYVAEDEKIDPDALLKTLKENNKAGIEERRKQRLPPLYLEGWSTLPKYDSVNKILEWGTKIHTDSNEQIINYTNRIFGRNGHMRVTLVSNPKTIDKDIQSFKSALKNFDFKNGEKYSEWREGDKVAAYGMTALIVGGAVAAVASKGGFKFLWAIALAAFAGLAGIFKKFFGKKE